MKAKKGHFLITVISIVCLQFNANAQNDTAYRHGLSLEARVTTYLQSGVDFGVYYYPKRSKFSFGLLAAAHDINGNTRELLFKSNDRDNLDIRLNWIISANTRYHFSRHREGFFAELGIGMEEFEVKKGLESFANTNGFVALAAGYIWHPWGRKGFYIMPKIGAPLIISAPDEQQFSDNNTFQLKPFFVTPSVAIGWKFEL